MTAIAVLFDMDGVLVDSAALHVRAYEQVFAEAGIELCEAARAAVRAGKPRREVIEIAVPNASAAAKQGLFDAKAEAVAAVIRTTKSIAMPGAAWATKALSDAGIPVGVVTNSRTPGIWLEAGGLSDKVNVVVSGNDVDAPKPAPEGFLLAADRLGVNPVDCLAFEDSEDGWLAATRAGMHVVLVSDRRPAWLPEDAETTSALDASASLNRCIAAASKVRA